MSRATTKSERRELRQGEVVEGLVEPTKMKTKRRLMIAFVFVFVVLRLLSCSDRSRRLSLELAVI